MTRITGPDCAVMCNLINTHTHIHTHTQHGEEDTSMLGQAEARRLGARDAGRADVIPLRRRTRRMCAPHAGQFDGGQGPRDCPYRCSTEPAQV